MSLLMPCMKCGAEVCQIGVPLCVRCEAREAPRPDPLLRCPECAYPLTEGDHYECLWRVALAVHDWAPKLTSPGGLNPPGYCPPLERLAAILSHRPAAAAPREAPPVEPRDVPAGGYVQAGGVWLPAAPPCPTPWCRLVAGHPGMHRAPSEVETLRQRAESAEALLAAARRERDALAHLLSMVTLEEMGGTPDLFAPVGGWETWDEAAREALAARKEPTDG